MKTNSLRLVLANTEALAQQMADAALAESLAARLAVRGEARFDAEGESPRDTGRTWLLLSGPLSTGVAIDTLYPTKTRLAATLSLSRCAALVAGAIASGEWPDGEWDPSSTSDASWRSVTIDTALGDLHLVCKGDSSQLPPYALEGAGTTPPRATVPITLVGQYVLRAKVGERCVLGQAVPCTIDGLHGSVFFRGDGRMELQLVRNEDDQQDRCENVEKECVDIVIELGVLGLSFQDLCRLRKGMKITVQSPDTMNCLLKIGETKVAVAEVGLEGHDGLSLVLREVF